MSSNVPAARLTNSVGSVRQQRRLALIGRIFLAIVMLFFALFPVVWIFSASINPTNSLAAQNLLPENATVENYRNLVGSDSFPFFRWMWNSLKLAIVTTLIGLLFTSMAAYAFSRFRFRGRRSLLQSILLIQVFPNFLNMVALFLILQQLGSYVPWLALNTHGGLILVYLGGVLGINTWLLKGFYDSIPRDLDEAAEIDGASPWQTFWRVLFPLVRPMLVIVGLLSFVGTYSDYVLARIMLQDVDQYTLAVGLNLFIGDQFSQRWGQFAAGALIGILPTLIIFLSLQRYLVSGLTAGSVKG